MSNKSKYIRDHVGTYAPRSREATNKHYGINNALILKAVNGDDAALKAIGDMGEVGDRMTALMPTIKDKLNSYVNGLTEYNKALSELYQNGAKGSAQITDAGSKLTLAEAKYKNLMTESKESLAIGLNQEHDRHTDRMDIIKLQAWIDRHTNEVNVQANWDSVNNKPAMMQLKADKDYNSKKSQHILEHGSNADLSLIPQKQYVTTTERVWNTVKSWFN